MAVRDRWFLFFPGECPVSGWHLALPGQNRSDKGLKSAAESRHSWQSSFYAVN
jgi:hypothetical protein